MSWSIKAMGQAFNEVQCHAAGTTPRLDFRLQLLRDAGRRIGESDFNVRPFRQRRVWYHTALSYDALDARCHDEVLLD
jgi:hypothetical protein